MPCWRGGDGDDFATGGHTHDSPNPDADSDVHRRAVSHACRHGHTGQRSADAHTDDGAFGYAHGSAKSVSIADTLGERGA